MTSEPQPARLPPSRYFEDPQRPQGALAPDAPMPGWLESTFRRINQAILDVVHVEQHDYLETRKLPHALKPHELKTKPHLLPDGSVIALTHFPVASESCFVAIYTPVFASGHDPMGATQAPADDEVTDYRIFAYQERGRFASECVPQTAAPHILAELKRQARAIGLRNMQFLYFTLLKPQVVEAFDDPHGYLQALQTRTSPEEPQ